MKFIFLDAEGIGKFETKFRDELLEKSELTFDELAMLSKREFNELINAEFIDVVVDEDNIHLYYEFMGDEDIKNNIDVLYSLFMDRAIKIQVALNLTPKELHAFATGELKALFIFGVKDTLKPIDEYIAEIKSSSEYKEYISKDFKLSVVTYIEDNYIQKETGIRCVDDIDIVMRELSGEEIFRDFDLQDFSIQNITLFIDNYLGLYKQK